jgi:hypothetical protein
MVHHDRQCSTGSDRSSSLGKKAPFVVDQIEEVDGARVVEGVISETGQIGKASANRRTFCDRLFQKCLGEIDPDGPWPRHGHGLPIATSQISNPAGQIACEHSVQGMHIGRVDGVTRYLACPPIRYWIPVACNGCFVFVHVSYSVPHQMPESTNDLVGTERRRQLLLTASTAAVFAFIVSYVFAILNINDVLRTGLVSDIGSFEDIAEAMFDGLLPYFDFPFEHLPMGAVPIAVVGIATKVTGVSMWLLWPLFMTPLFVATAMWVDRLDPDDPPGFRFVAVSLPMLPLVLFRLEPWIEFLAVAGLLAFIVGNAVRGATLTVLATLGKGWPIVIAMLPWKLGKRRAAFTVVFVSMVLLTVVASLEGFQSGRAFEGIHTETVVGSLVLLVRHLTGAALGTTPAAGALYIDVPPVMVIVNAIPGVLLIGIGILSAIRLTVSSTLSTIGITILGIILASPLSSTQFIFWIAPFVALLGFGLRRMYVIAGLFAFASIAIYEPFGLLWNIEVVARNVALLALGGMWAMTLVESMRQPTASALP